MRNGAMVAAGALAIACPAGALAATDLPEVTDAVPGRPGVTYLDLLRQAIPDLAMNAADKQVEGHLKSLRHIMGKGAGGDPPDPVVADFLEVRHIKAGGRPRLVVLANLGQSDESAQSTTLLALYDEAPKPKLLDAVDVGVDKDTSFNEKPSQIALGPGYDALVTYSEHGNSNQSYQARLVIYVRGDHFRLIDEVFVLSDNACGYQRDETPAFTTKSATPYATLEVIVTERLKHLDEDCGDERAPAPYVHTYRATYSWDAAKGAFVEKGDLAKLDRLNRGAVLMARRKILALAGLVLAGALAMFVAAPAFADEGRLMDAGDAVPDHPGMTYEDLVRLAVPDLALSPDDHRVEGHLAAAPRHLAGPEYQDDDPSDLAVELGAVEDKRILVGGKKRIALLADLGGHEGRIEGTALLILLDDEGPTPKLIDMADVALDQDTVFAEQAVLPLGPGDVALVTWSEHDDADLTLGGYMLISPIGDHLAMVARIALTSENLCSWHGLETVHFATTPDASGPYRRILATAKAVFTGTGEDGCNDEKHPKGTHIFHASWRWSPVSRRYETARSTLGGLDALNKKFFGD